MTQSRDYDARSKSSQSQVMKNWMPKSSQSQVMKNWMPKSSQSQVMKNWMPKSSQSQVKYKKNKSENTENFQIFKLKLKIINYSFN
jgi:hypothetical protein